MLADWPVWFCFGVDKNALFNLWSAMGGDASVINDFDKFTFYFEDWRRKGRGGLQMQKTFPKFVKFIGNEIAESNTRTFLCNDSPSIY